MSEFWKPKPGPIFTIGRIAHFVVAFTVPIWFAGASGYAGLGFAIAGMLLFSIAWEVGTRWFSWSHPWGDVIDLLAFVAGTLAGGAIGLLFC